MNKRYFVLFIVIIFWVIVFTLQSLYNDEKTAINSELIAESTTSIKSEKVDTMITANSKINNVLHDNRNSPDLFSIIDEQGNFIKQKPSKIDKTNAGYSESVRLPTTHHTTTPAFNERQKYGINTSSSYNGWKEDLKYAKQQERNELIIKIFSIIGVIMLVTVAIYFIKTLLKNEDTILQKQENS
jgi:hypothetical protein